MDLWHQWHAPSTALPYEALRSAADFVDARSAGLPLPSPWSLKPCPDLSFSQTCHVSVGEFWSWNEGPAQVLLGQATLCEYLPLHTTYGQFVSTEAAVEVPPGTGLAWTGGFPGTFQHEGAVHLGPTCIVTNSSTFSMVVNSGALWFKT